MEKWQLIMNELQAMTDILKKLNDKPMAIDKPTIIEYENFTVDISNPIVIDKYVGCIYCGEPKGDRLSCCGENHFEEMYDEEE